MCLITGNLARAFGLTGHDYVYDGYSKKDDRKNDRNVKEGLLHAAAFGINTAVATPEQTAQARSFGLQQNEYDEGDRDNDQYQAQEGFQRDPPRIKSGLHQCKVKL
jgi:hypothetical protein